MAKAYVTGTVALLVLAGGAESGLIYVVGALCSIELMMEKHETTN